VEIKIVLVCPQLAENIGAVARVMSNFGLENLRIVSPRDGWPPSEKAYELAAKGEYIVKNAEIYKDVDSALLDLNFVIAATARTRYMEKKLSTPRESVSHCNTKLSKVSKIGIMFGRENNGLSNAELGLADLLAIIPTSDKNPSLNLAQAVSIFAYEFYSAQNTMPSKGRADLCSKEELVNLMSYIVTSLERKEYFKEPNIKRHMIQNMQNIFVKAGVTSQEVSTLMGVVRALLS
jgi:tRNA/rRNA methyltransferase